jgi:hypothetical protein
MFLFPHLARPVLGHTVKELVSRGLKSRSGGFTKVSTAIDILSLGRPRLWRPAKLDAAHTPRQPILTSFLNFFPNSEKQAVFAVNLGNPVDLAA